MKHKNILFLVGLLLTTVVLAGCAKQVPVTSPPIQPTSTPGGNLQIKHDIAIQNFAFSPADLTIRKGETVIWTNVDSAPHTVTSDQGSELDSAKLSKGETYAHTFTEPGTYTYYCTVHPMMKGRIIVT